MLNEAYSILNGQLKGGEDIQWWSQPRGEDNTRLWLFTYDLLKRIAAISLVLSVIIFYAGAINFDISNFRGPFSMVGIQKVLNPVALFFLGGLLLLMLRDWLIPRFMNEQVRTVYAITNKRIMVINKHSSKDIRVRAFSIGEMRDPFSVTNRNGTKDVLFVDTLREADGEEQKHIDWEGFFDLVDHKAAIKAINEWRKSRSKGGGKYHSNMASKNLGLELVTPEDWTKKPLFLPPDERDNLMFAMIGATADGFNNFMTGLNSDGNWNTIVLNQKGHSQAKNQKAIVDYYTIVVQSVITDNKTDATMELKHQKPKKFQTYIEQSNEGVDAINDALLICRLTQLFDKGKKKIRINKKANSYRQLNDEKKGWNCHQMDGGFKLPGMDLLIYQIYMFKDGVHVRIIAIGPGPVKEKPFGMVKGIAIDIAKSVELTADKRKVEQEPPPPPKPPKNKQNTKEKKAESKEKPAEKEKAAEVVEEAAEKPKAAEKKGPEIIQY